MKNISSQVVGTALLLLGVSAVGYKKNSKMSSIIGPLLVAFLVMAIGICFGHNAGYLSYFTRIVQILCLVSARYAINPARDLGPRVMTWMFGWGGQVWTHSSYWFWIPVVCCHLGGILGAGLHWLLIEWEDWCGCGHVEVEMEMENTV